LAEAEPAMLLRHREAEDAEASEFLDHLDGDQLVLAMPGLRVLAVSFGEAVELLADQDERIVAQRRFAESVLRDQDCETLSNAGAVALAHKTRGGAVIAQGPNLILDAEVGGADDFALAHGDAAGHLREVFAK